MMGRNKAMRAPLALALAGAALTLAACAPEPGQDPRPTGVALGAATGAAAGQALGRDTRSTVIGAGVGAIGGGIVATEQARREGLVP
jgi:hypothetical protein